MPYGEEELKSAFERMTVVAIEALGGDETNAMDHMADPNFAGATMDAVGIDKDGAFEYMRGIVPMMVQVLFQAATDRKDAVADDGDFVEYALVPDDINGMVATVLIRGLCMGILLTEPEHGNNQKIIDTLYESTVDLDTLREARQAG